MANDVTCVKFFRQFRAYIRENCKKFETAQNEKKTFDDEDQRKMHLDENIAQCVRDAFVSGDSEESKTKWENLLDSMLGKNTQLYCATRVLRNLSMQEVPNWQREAGKVAKSEPACEKLLPRQKKSKHPVENTPVPAGAPAPDRATTPDKPPRRR
ncbi:MAG: hypothetical protein V2A66_07465 [Pseudomonadota bacterium]